MDPISLALGVVGLGMQIFGGSQQAQASHEIAQASQDEARQEQGINDTKQRQMELEGRRANMQNIRNEQRARAMAISSATSQGANKGSGLQGGLAQITDQSNFNIFGVDAAIDAGRQLNTYNQAITQDKIKTAGYQSDAATGAGIASMGGALMKAGPIVGQVSQGFGKNNFGSIFMGGGTPSGYGSRQV